MTEQANARQSLSALMDDEAGEFEVRRVLKEMASDPEVARAWSRYQAVRAVMKGEYRAQALALSEQVCASIAREPAHQGVNSEPAAPAAAASSGGLWRTLASMAVAASVTAVMIIGFQSGGVGSPGAEATIAQAEEVRISQPRPPSNVLRAQFGQSGLGAPLQSNPDVIRYSEGLDYYLRQHQALLVSEAPTWGAGWVPEGFSPVRHEVKSDSEVILFSNGRTVFSICVEPAAAKKAPDGVARWGDTIAFGKQVDDRFITVVGHVPLMVADRIASSVHPTRN